MNSVEEQVQIQRILVALDASAHSLAALEAAAELAQQLNAELLGLFVEDANLLRLCALPFARPVSSLSGTVHSLDARQLERQLRAQAARAALALERIAEQRHVHWQFRVARGLVASEVLAAASQADLVILGRAGASLRGRQRTGSTLRAVLARGRGLTLVLEPGKRLEQPVLLLYDGSPPARLALEAAARLALTRQRPLRVLATAPIAEESRRLRAEAEARLKGLGLEAAYRLLTGGGLSHLLQILRLEGGSPLVLPCGGGLLTEEEVQTLVEALPDPVLLVRP